MTRTGGRLLADQLVRHGVDLAFCVPGESYLGLLDGLWEHRDAVRVVTCRHEAGAANAAEAYGKLTGRPGVCMVTRGPGATHASNGVHTARQDSTPMVLLVGQVATGERGREGFQEVDYGAAFGPLAKWAWEIDDADRIPELVARAFSVAVSGRPGPVVLALPEDVLAAESDAEDAAPYTVSSPAANLAPLHERLLRAERPLVMVGGGPWDEESSRRLTAWAEESELPVVASFRRQDVVDNRSPSYVGVSGLGIDPRLAQRMRDCDLLVAAGTRLSEIETQGYTIPAPPRPAMGLVHVHPDPDELGRVYEPELAVLSGVRELAAGLRRLDGGWGEWTRAARADYEAFLGHAPAPGEGVDLGEVMTFLREELPEDAVICNGAGNYTVWVHRFTQYRRWGTQLAPQSGSMGYGLPAALAAQLLHPDRLVVAFAGDGCFSMQAHELATAVQEELPIVVIVVDNGVLGTIRMHQERRFPRRVIGTDLVNPDWAALARAYGAHGETVTATEDFPAAWARAREAGRPALLEVVTDPEALTPTTSLSALAGAG